MLDPLPAARLPRWPLVLGCAFFLLIGLLGHDPWKTDDALNLGVAYEFALGGDWLTPRIALDSWWAQPPLFHWLAALWGKLLGGLIGFHNAARLATATSAGLLLFCLSRASRALLPTIDPRGIILLMVGTVGLLLPIHEAQPFVLLIAAQAAQLWALAARQMPPFRRHTLMLAAMTGGLLSTGLSAAPILLIPPLLVASHPQLGIGRRSIYLSVLLGAGLAALWPLALYLYNPAGFYQFLSLELGKLSFQIPTREILADQLELFAWSSWPLWPFALWGAYADRRQWRNSALFLPLAVLLVGLSQALFLGDARPLSQLILIPPLGLLAAAGVERLRRGAANAFDWFGMMTFTLIAGLIWLGGIAMMSGEPARVAKNFTKSEPGFTGAMDYPALVFAGAISLIWLWSLWKLPRSPWRGTLHWAGGMALMWGLLASLWMPWMNYGKTYRPVALSLASALGEGASGGKDCVSSVGLGDAQKASLRYFIGLAPLSNERSIPRRVSCSWLLVQGAARNESALDGWQRVWEGNRSGDKSEKLRLYRRAPRSNEATP